MKEVKEVKRKVNTKFELKKKWIEIMDKVHKLESLSKEVK